MNFKQFLTGKTEASGTKHEIVYQQMIDALDNAHIEYNNDLIEFNLGVVIDDPRLSDLNVIIKAAGLDSVALVERASTEKKYIMIKTTKKFPERKEIDTFFSEDKPLLKSFTRELKKFIKVFGLSDAAHAQDEEISLRDKGTFEEKYSKLIQKVKSEEKNIRATIDDIKTKLDTLASESKRQTALLAIKKLESELKGQNEKDFLKKVMQYEEAAFVGRLQKDMKSKVERRLLSYYKQL